MYGQQLLSLSAVGLHVFQMYLQEHSEAREKVFSLWYAYERQIVGIAFDKSKSERTWPFYDTLHEACKIVSIQTVKNNTENGWEYSFGISLLSVFKPLTSVSEVSDAGFCFKSPVANRSTEIHYFGLCYWKKCFRSLERFKYRM
jgi:hypothetical protein